MADFKFANEWSRAARVDPRYRDPVAPLEGPEASELPAIAAAELLDQVELEELPRAPVAESWGSMHASPPRKLTAEIVEEILRLRESGWTWPRIAARFSVHKFSARGPSALADGGIAAPEC
jgi:hypothetical protein